MIKELEQKPPQAETDFSVEKQQNIEEARLHVLIEQYKDRLGDFELVRVNNNVGYVLQSKNHLPMAGNDWLFFDYDDTLVGTTEVKELRLAQYLEYVSEQNLSLSEQQATRIMDETDRFSRWEENPGEGDLYHANAHMTVLSWATQQFKVNPDTISQTIETIISTLERIKLQILNTDSAKSSDPFSLKNKKLVLKESKRPWSESIEKIFMSTIMNPPHFNETIQAGVVAGSPMDSIHRTNVGIFTYGDPYFQLLKTFELLMQHPDLPISQIWLTRTPKGEFITAVSQTAELSTLDQEYVPPELCEYDGDGASAGSGHVLSNYPHTIVMIDDDPKQLTSIFNTNEFLAQNTGAQFVVIRTIRPKTKAEKREWQIETKNGILDFSSNSFQESDVSKIILLNRYIVTKTNLGETHQNTLRLQEQLERLGITL
ncbi:MAG: hypothetical protein GW762_02535 [Candidatus Pacebacteria bacterium]|nr:hypothetical protein [Candidatus Paceibacterota bacterium]PIR64112.1 MAG: hypothetical protein COU64_01025 [Candidatus Pacebacteria bacterium CG10_big_fil_rev_8_21_14_0_10_40_26]PIZ78464.1 MAG: hypothetical protein COY01_04405 [Candidatus Pacebacteria bacterium CG_4_10_14_0_2_um_filter_40_20]PJA69314.1 MAG: hypothetical protein CO156_00290 [Candidatus Pacebacteria bacterium CG_4_9_14_3_um_filter_40_12]PJC41997.1 MAG: hypothetical protein CO041_01845 [Candidatus Pacebacteria bacterium CG_4_9_